MINSIVLLLILILIGHNMVFIRPRLQAHHEERGSHSQAKPQFRGSKGEDYRNRENKKNKNKSIQLLLHLAFLPLQTGAHFFAKTLEI